MHYIILPAGKRPQAYAQDEQTIARRVAAGELVKVEGKPPFYREVEAPAAEPEPEQTYTTREMTAEPPPPPPPRRRRKTTSNG